MGTSFDNIQIYLGERDLEEVRAQTLEALAQRLRSLDYIETDFGDPKIETVVATAIKPGNPWLSVYGDFSAPDPDRLLDEGEPGLIGISQVATMLSKVTGTKVVSIFVCDSDVLDLRLCEHGDLIDIFSSYPEIYQTAYAEQDNTTGRPELWQGIFLEGYSIDNLRNAFSERPTLAESQLKGIAEIIGLDSTLIHGYAGSFLDFKGGRLTLADIPSYLDWTCQAFRSTKLQPFEQFAEGPPKFIWGGGGGYPYITPGAIQEYHLDFYSTGGASKGIKVEFSGKLLEQAFVKIVQCELAFRAETYPVSLARQGDAYVGVLPNLEIPTGLIDPIEAHMHMSLRYPEARKILRKIEYSLRFSCTGERISNGEINVVIKPIDNPDDGKIFQNELIIITDQPPQR